MLSLKKTARLFALGVGLLLLAGSSAPAFEIGSCALILVKQEESSGKSEGPHIVVKASVLKKQGLSASDPATQTDLSGLGAAKPGGSGSEFGTSRFTLPDETSTDQGTGLFDFSTDSSGY